MIVCESGMIQLAGKFGGQAREKERERKGRHDQWFIHVICERVKDTEGGEANTGSEIWSVNLPVSDFMLYFIYK